MMKSLSDIEQTDEKIVESRTINDIELSHPQDNGVLLEQYASLEEAVIGEEIEFKIIAKNISDLDVDNVIIRDILKSEFKFVDNTVEIDGVLKKNQNILFGINIGKLEKGCFKEIKFKVKVISRSEEGIVTNVAIGEYQYKNMQDNIVLQYNIISNIVEVIIQEVNIYIDKNIDKNEVSLGEEVTYTISLINKGTVNVKNLYLREIINKAFDIIEGQFYLNKKRINSVNLNKGISIGNLDIGEKIDIVYKVKYATINNRIQAPNTTKLNFYYQKTNGLIFKATEIEKTRSINLRISTFKYKVMSEKIYKDRSNPDICEVENVEANLDIIEHHLVKTIKGKSNEGQILTGYKVVIQGMLKVIVEYRALDGDKSVHILKSSIPFSTFIVLPDNFIEGSKINIDFNIENINFEKIDTESVYVNIYLLLIAKIQSAVL